MKKVFLFLTLFSWGCATLSAQVVNPCSPSAQCLPTWRCVEHLEKQMTWTNYGIWLNTHQGYDREVHYANASYVWFSWWDNCTKPVICYDNEGECQ